MIKLTASLRRTLPLQFHFSFIKNQREARPRRNQTQQYSSSFKDIKVLFDKNQAETIEKINKHFQGIRINTKYDKFYNEDLFENTAKAASRRITDLPFKPSTFVEPDMSKVQISKLAQHILNKVETEALKRKLIDMTEKYLQDIVNRTRTVQVQPNFEREAHVTISSLKTEGYIFDLSQKKQSPRVQLLKGLQVIRNNNYTVDSYQMIKQEDHTNYRLWQRGVYKIPQNQWFVQQKMLLQLTAQIQAPFLITISSKNTKAIPTEVANPSHTIVFETDLRRPPKFASFRMSPRQYLEAYEINLDEFWITNVDGRNGNFGYLYEQHEKRKKLINKLV